MNRTKTVCRVLPSCALAAAVAGCASPGGSSALLTRAEAAASDAPASVAEASHVPPVGAEPIPDPLQLNDALGLALRQNPELIAASHGLRAAEARVLQAGRRPNPELELGIEEFDRDGGGLDSAEMEVAVSQVFEWGGKRGLRTRVAGAEEHLAVRGYESKRLDVLAETRRRFVAVVAARERLALAEAAAETAEQTARAVQERVSAGKEPPLQAAKAGAEMELSRLEQAAARNALQAAAAGLAAMWGADNPPAMNVQGELAAALDEIPNLESLRSRLGANPELLGWDARIRLGEAALASATAARIPDLEVSAGIQRFEEDGTDAFAFGVGIPLPLFDQNRDGIETARYDLEQTRAEFLAARSALHAELAQAHADFATAHQRVETLNASVIPAMQQAFESAQEGYRQGKFGFLDMLDAQRGLFETKGALIDAWSAYHEALAEIQRIAGSTADHR